MAIKYAARGISTQMRTPDELLFEDGVTLKPVDGGDVFVEDSDLETIHIGIDYNASTGGCTVKGVVYGSTEELKEFNYYVLISAFTAYEFATGTIAGIGYDSDGYYIPPSFSYCKFLSELVIVAGYYRTDTVPTQTTVWRLSDDTEGTRYTGSEGDAAVVSGNQRFYYNSLAECNAVWTTEQPLTALCFTNVDTEISSVKLSVNGTLTTDYETSPDGINWSAYTMGTAIPLETGGKVYFRGTRSTQSTSNYLQFSMTGKIAASGNVNSLLAKTGFNAITDLTPYGGYTFYYLFIFCSQLTTAPELPATTLVSNCYAFMFYGCTSLQKAPTLPATTSVTGCYIRMFYECSSLDEVRCYLHSHNSSRTSSWTTRVSASGTFYKSALASNWETGTSGIPSGWTVVNVEE